MKTLRTVTAWLMVIVCEKGFSLTVKCKNDY